MYKAVIFDVDGTLVDTVDSHAKAWQDTFKEFGYEIDFGDIRHQIGKGGDQIIPMYLSPEDVEEKGKAIEERRHEIYMTQYLNEATAFPQVRELFETLRADNKQIVLASSAKKDQLEHYKDITNIEDLLEHETSSEDAEESKPEPDIFLAALDKLDGVSSDEAVVIGDSPHDAIAANRAKIATIGFLCGGFDQSELESAGCIAIYQDPADLLAHYRESPIQK